MSFILDALRKSEHARQRERGPALAEVAVAQPRLKKNVWPTVAVALLVVNLVAIGVVLLRHAGTGSSEATSAQANSIASGVSAETSAAAAASDESSTGPIAGGDGSPVTAAAGSGPAAATGSGLVDADVASPAYKLPPVLQPALPADGTGASRNPLAEELSDTDPAEAGYAAEYDSGPAYPAAPPAYPGGGRAAGAPKKGGSVVYERLPEADPITSPANAAALARAEQEAAYARQGVDAQPRAVSETPALPTIDEVGQQAGLPELSLNLHVWSTKPEERIVFVNSRRYKEGDTLEEGPRVDRITKDGVELSYRGSRFSIPRQ